MSLIVADRVQETTNTAGTGAYTLGGAVAGFQTFASVASDTDTVYYSITDNVDFEVGLGTYASGAGTIARTTVFSSSNSDAAVDWGVGTKNIFLTYPADKAVIEDGSNNVTIGNNVVVGGTVDGRDVAADGTKLDFVTVTQAVDLDQMETDIAALANGMVYKGDWNAGSGSFPGGGSAQTGWFYYVSGAGTVNGISFAVGDNIVATTDNASTSTYAGNWSKHDQTDAVQSVVGLTGSIAKSSLLSALNVEDGADATDTANVTSAGALMASEVDADIKTLSLPASTTISAYGKTLVDDADAAAARTTLGLGTASTTAASAYATAAQGTTADAALPRAGGAMTGAITTNSTFDGRDVATDGSKLDGIETGATADQTITAGSGLSGGGTGNITISHADTSSQGSVNNSGATVIQDVTLDTYGHVTGLGSHTLTLADLGYTGATNANYITNNNQLTNGAGYTTNVGDITGVTAGTNLTGGGSSGSVTLNVTASPTFTTVTATTFNTTSDRNTKTDIEPISDAVSKVQQLGGYSFTFKDSGEKSSGVIAQEVQAVLPELVQVSDAGNLTVQYGNMVGLLIEAIKEQQAQIDALTAKLNG